jgi:hypothetical protein
MSNTNTGGTAFPCHTIAMHEGMTLRDYFAAKAMQGWLASFTSEMQPNPERIAEFCYAMADAMLRAREQ